MGKLINGNQIAADIKNEIKKQVDELFSSKGVKPGLAVILVGENPASKVYVSNKQKGCDEVGFASETIRMPDTASTGDVLEQIDLLNKRPDIHGLLVQLPLPPQIDKNRVLEAILPQKDVDGFHPINMGRLVAQEDCLIPATASGIIEMLKREKVVMKGANAVMVGHSEIVGKPTTLLLLNEWATVTICHVETKDLKMHTKNADILIVATGVPYLIKEDMVKEGAVVIDVGINRITKEKANPALLEWRKEDFETKGATLIGDVDFLNIEPKASLITPVPGGVGVMTVAMLLYNTMKAAKNLASK